MVTMEPATVIRVMVTDTAVEDILEIIQKEDTAVMVTMELATVIRVMVTDTAVEDILEIIQEEDTAGMVTAIGVMVTDTVEDTTVII